MDKPNMYSKTTGLNRLFSQVCYLQRTEYLQVKNDNIFCFQNVEVDFQKIGAMAIIQEGATTRLNKPVHLSPDFEVQEGDISEGSEDT